MIIFISPCRIILYFRSGMSSFQTYSHTRFPHPFAVTCSALYAQCPAPKPLSSHFTTFTPWSYFTGSFPSGPDIPRYRYFFNGKEADNEVYGEGGFQNYGFRVYDTRLGRFWGVDPLTKDYPMLTPFQFASCSPVLLIDMDGLEGIENTQGNMEGGVVHTYFNARQSTYVVSKALPEVELKRPLFKVTTQQHLPYVGEIRPAKSDYEKWWEETAGPFADNLRTDKVLQATSTGIFAVFSFSSAEQLATQTLPYMVRGGEALFSTGLKVYNNPLGKRAIGIGLGYVGYKQGWSPDISFPDPTISTYSLLSQFMFDIWDKNKTIFDDKQNLNTNKLPQNIKDNAKSDHTQ